MNPVTFHSVTLKNFTAEQLCCVQQEIVDLEARR